MKVTAVQLALNESAGGAEKRPLVEMIRMSLARALHDGVRVLLFPLYEGVLSPEKISPALADLQETARLGRMMICISRAAGRTTLIDTDGTVMGEVGVEIEGRVFKTTLGKVGVTTARGGKFFKVAENLVESSARLVLHPMNALAGISFEALDQMRSEHTSHWKYALVASNFVGVADAGDHFAGCSLVALSNGEVPVKASMDAPDFVSVELPSGSMDDEGLLQDRFRLLPKLRRIAEITRFTPPII